MSLTNLYLDEIEKHIKKIEQDEKNEIIKSVQILTFFESKLDELKSFIVQYDFKTEEEEILFFKEIKPKIWSNLIYYMSVYRTEINRPKGSILALPNIRYVEGNKNTLILHYVT